MAQYDLEVDVLEDNIANSDLDTETQNAINEALAALGDDGGVTIEELTGNDTSNAADAEFLSVEDEDGIEIGDTDAAVILAGDGSGSLSIEITTSNDEGERTIVASGTSDQVVIQSDDNANIDAGDGDDTVTTGGGSDSIGGGAGNDSINAGAGGDSIEAGDGSDSVDGGEGFDEVVFTAPIADGGIQINDDGSVSITNAAGDTTSIENVEYIDTGDGNAVIITESEEEAAAASLFSIMFGETASKDQFLGVKDSIDGGQGVGDIVGGLTGAFEQATAGLSDVETVGFVFDNFLNSGDEVPTALLPFLQDFLLGNSIDKTEMLQALAESTEVLETLGNIGIDSNGV